MKRPIYVIGSGEPIGYEDVPEATVMATDVDGKPFDWDVTANIRKQAYDAYMRAGFARDQAIELCKVIQF